MHRRLAAAVLPVLVLVTAPSAFADVTPPDVSACSGKSAGAACAPSAGVVGACVASKCSRFDYGSWDRDASSTPPTVEYACVRCVAGATPADAGSGTDAGTTPAASDDSGGCSLAARKAGPWALAVVPALVLAFVERRRSPHRHRQADAAHGNASPITRQFRRQRVHCR